MKRQQCEVPVEYFRCSRPGLISGSRRSQCKSHLNHEVNAQGFGISPEPCRNMCEGIS